MRSLLLYQSAEEKSNAIKSDKLAGQAVSPYFAIFELGDIPDKRECTARVIKELHPYPKQRSARIVELLLDR